MNWSGLWQPRHPAFWLLLMFNLLSSLCAWALRSLPLSAGGSLTVAALAIGNVLFGLWAGWVLVRRPSLPKPSHGKGTASTS